MPCVLTRIGERKGKPGVVQEVSASHVAFAFDGGAVLYVPHDEIKSLDAGKAEPEEEASK